MLTKYIYKCDYSIIKKIFNNYIVTFDGLIIEEFSTKTGVKITTKYLLINLIPLLLHPCNVSNVSF